MTEQLRILGIDPGSRLTGFGVVDFKGDQPSYVASGSINSIDGEFADRLKLIFHSVSEICAEYRPDVMCIESVFVAKSAGSALKLGHARSAAICATFGHDVLISEYAPRAIKQALVGNGNASKEQVKHMVIAMLQLQGAPSADAADALAAALCHGHHRKLALQITHASALAGLR